MKKYQKILPLVCLGIFFAGIVSAAGLVPCGNAGEPACQLCHLWVMFDGVIKFVLYNLVLPGAVLLFAYAGVKLLLSGGNPTKVGEAKNIFTNTVWGLVIIFCSWLIIGTIINTLGSGSQAFQIIGAWNKYPSCPIIP